MTTAQRAKLTDTALTALLFTAWIVIVPATLNAQTAVPTYEPRAAFKETDTNQDGQIDQVEFDERMTEVFYHADINKDGVLTVTEITVTLVQTTLKPADTNGDAKLTLHEFLRVRSVDFETADTNDDGVLRVEEVVAVYEKDSQR